MGLKKFINSHSGRAALLLTSLVVASLLITSGILTYLIYYPQSLQNTFEGHLKDKATSWGAHDLKVAPESTPLIGLPSATLSYKADVSSTSFTPAKLMTNPVGFAYESLNKQSLDSLMNTSVVFQDPKATTAGPKYTFKFYSGSLKDYSSNGAYQQAASQFLAIYNLSGNHIDFVSKPTPSGGREVTVSFQSNQNFDKASAGAGPQLWASLVSTLTDKTLVSKNTLVRLTMSDPQAITVKTVLASPEDATAATSFAPALWTTFSAYAYEDSLSFLKVSKLVYNVERTPEDSTLTVTVDKAAQSNPNLRAQILNASIKSDTAILVVWSYNTYLVTPEGKTPFLTFNSSSQNW